MLHDRLKMVPLEMWPMHKTIGDVGVELEIEGTNLVIEGDTAIPGWNIKLEHSLRGECREYTTRGAVSLDKLPKSIDNLLSAFQKKGTVVVPSDRCSTHIHVNMQQRPLREYFGFVFVFTILEPVLLRLCGPARNGNLFCMPSYETGDLGRTLAHQCQYLMMGHHSWYGRGKYAALCLDHMATFGSLEARCFPLSIDKNEIIKWSTWLCRMREIAETWPDETYSNLGLSPEDLAYRVFAGTNLFPACQPENVSQLLELGAENAYEAWRGARSMFFYEKTDKPMSGLLGKKKFAAPEVIYHDDVEGDF